MSRSLDTLVRGAFRALLVSAILSVGAVAAAPTAAESGTIINLAGRQRMLSQKLTKELLLVALDLNKDTNLQNAAATATLFDSTLKALRHGDAALGLPPTENAPILRQLDTVAATWSEYHKVVEAVLEARALAPEQVARIAELNLPLLEEMDRCVKLFEQQASSGTMAEKPALAVAINLAGRQRMLSQRMSKEYLLLALGHQSEDTRRQLAETVALFTRTLQGLRDGDEKLGLSAAVNTPEVVAQLEVVAKCWQGLEPSIRAALANHPDAFKPGALRAVATESVRVLAEMNKVVALYEASTR